MKVNEDDLQCHSVDEGGKPIWEYNGNRFTGTLCSYEAGKLCYEQECVNGFEEGWCRSYYSNGQKEKEYKKHFNQLVPGTYTSWDEDGNVTGNL